MKTGRTFRVFKNRSVGKGKKGEKKVKRPWWTVGRKV